MSQPAAAADPLRQRAETTPDRTAVVDAETGETWTYRTFDERVDGVAARLEAVVPDRDRAIGLLLPARVEFAVAFFAAVRRGLQVVPLSVRETPAELGRKADRVGLAAVVCERETEALALETVDAPIFSVDDPATGAVDRLEPAPGTQPTQTAFDADRTQLVLFTSGTSGEPKGVRLTVANLVASATASAYRLGVSPDDRWLACLPPYHMGGLAPLVRSVCYGTTVVIQRGFDPEETANALEERGITGVSFVPTMLSRLLDAGWRPTDDLRFVLLGGAPASESLLERCADHDVPVHPSYGMTETASQVATARPADLAARPGTVGQPLACTTVTVVDDGAPVGPNETGELVVSGPTVTHGYLDEDATAAAFGEYGFHTGDVGYRDEDGYLWVIGRRSDRIVTGGENVDPAEVREALESHRDVRDAAVVGLDDPEWGERVAALVVLEAGASDPPSAVEVVAHCEGRLAGFKRPKTISFVDALPRTPSGTVDRDAVRERLAREDRNLAG